MNTHSLCSESFKELIFEYSYNQLVNFPTHTSGNTINLIIIPPDSAIISKPTQGNLISDHFVISFDILVSPFIFSDHVKHYRNISKINLQLFINSVYAYISIHNTSLANYISYDNFNDALRYYLDAHSPLIISTKKYGAHSLWFNNDLVILRRRLRYHQLKFKRSKCFTHLESFKNIRSLYKKKLSAAKSSFYTDKLNKYGTSSKEAFKLAFSLIGKNRNKKLPDDNLCSLFADFLKIKF